MTWQTPKTDWATDDAVGTADLNRIEGNFLDIRLSEDANGRMGTVTFAPSDTSKVVTNSSITANTRIILTVQSTDGSYPGVHISSRSAGVSFTISRVNSFSGSVLWVLIEPA